MSGEAPARIDGERRAELARLLEERARLLAPAPDLVDRAIARCVRKDLRAQREQQAVEASGSGEAADEAEAEAVQEASTPTPTPISVIADAAEPVAAEPAETPKTVADSLGQAPVSTGDSLQRGRVIAGYRIEGTLGKGGMGQVYRAVQLSVEREVAFKVLSPKLAANKSFRERFLREARAAGRLHHPNLIGVHDVGEANGLMFFSMELIEGRTVKDLIGRDGTIPLERALDITAQTLSALRYAHERGVVHRDIKPDNIMVTDAGLVKVADLGLSRIDSLTEADESTSASTQAGTIMGTPHYMSPEQGRDAHSADPRSDLYSLGATLYHMLCGKPPFTGTSAVDVVMKAATQPLVFPDPGPPPSARTLISRLMAKKPEDRPASAEEALGLLENVRTGHTISHSRGRIHRVVRRRRLRRLLPLVVVSTIALAVLITLIVLLRRHADAQAWQREQQRIDAAAQANEWRRALDFVQADLQELPQGSPRAAELEAIRDDLQRRWDAWSAATAQPALDQFETAMRDKRYGDAAKVLRIEGEDALSPATKQQLDQRRDQLDHAVDDLLAKPAEQKPGEELARAIEQGRRWREQRFAPLVWARFTWAPATAAEHSDAGMVLHGNGSGALPLPQKSVGRDLRQIDIHLRFSAGPAGAERWTMQIGRARVDVGEAGVVATAADGKAETLSAIKGDGVLRLRRGADGAMQISAKEGTWFTLGPIDADLRVQLAWALEKDHTVEIGMLPVFERVIK